jgi:hypothetical protein
MHAENGMQSATPVTKRLRIATRHASNFMSGTNQAWLRIVK